MNTSELTKKAKEIRINIINMLAHAGSGHTAGPLGLTDIMTALYFEILQKEDKLILSCGHYVPVRYAVMAYKGLIPASELATLRKLGSKLQGHPDRRFFPEMETTSGPLGSGLAQSAGICLGMRLDKKPGRVYCITSDGEHNEGNHWEAVMFAAKYKLANLTQIVDRNGIQISGYTETVMPLGDLKDKYKSFGWHVLEAEGHDFTDIVNACKLAGTHKSGPTVIIAKTIAGKGVSFMENKYEWHGKVPTKEEAEKAVKELNNAK